MRISHQQYLLHTYDYHVWFLKSVELRSHKEFRFIKVHLHVSFFYKQKPASNCYCLKRQFRGLFCYQSQRWRSYKCSVRSTIYWRESDEEFIPKSLWLKSEVSIRTMIYFPLPWNDVTINRNNALEFYERGCFAFCHIVTNTSAE